MTRRTRAPQYGRPRPDADNQEIKKNATAEMQAYDELPPQLKEFVRTSNVGWKSAKVIEYWNRLGRDVDVTLQLLRGVEAQCFRDNQMPTGQVTTIQLRR